MNTHTIDATGKAIGRVASQAASLLLGKGSTAFRREKKDAIFVTIENASKVKLSPKKAAETITNTYSGYPGGFKESNWQTIAAKKGYGELFINAIHGMLPNNRLRKDLMKRLVIKE